VIFIYIFKRFWIFIYLILISIHPCLYAQTDAIHTDKNKYQLFIFKTNQAIVIDGKLTESAWKTAEVAGDFFQNFPFDTSFALSRTEARVTYDDRFFYVGAICYDPLPGDFIIQSLRRDFSYPISDAFAVYIEPFDDQTNGFNFTVNPAGVQREGLIATGGTSGVSTSWDNRWYSAVHHEPEKKYWSVEMAIPFKTLRYRKGATQWRINFSRNDLKRNENSSWYPVPRNFNIATLTFMGTLEWDSLPPPPGPNISLIPYAAGGVNQGFRPPSPQKTTYGLGGDAKVALTPALNLDLTINPDFAQVEVDRQVINLTRFNLFFPERRQFFIENSDLFEAFGFRQIRPFFSRKIGLYQGNTIPIIAGFRLSGKLNRDWRIGVMNMQTDKSEALRLAAQNYSVVAFQRQVFKTSNIAGIWVNRQQTGANGTDNWNRVIGIDYNLQSPNNRWRGKLFYHHSLTPEKKANSYAHASWLMFSTPTIFWMWNHEYVGKNYQADVGFVPRIDVFNGLTNQVVKMSYWRIEPEFRYKIFPKKPNNAKIINNYYIGCYTDLYLDSGFRFSERHINPYFGINFQSSATFTIGYHEYFTKLFFPIDVLGTGQTPLPAQNYVYRNVSAGYTFNPRRRFNGTLSAGYGSFYTATSTSSSFDLSYRLQPWGIFSVNVTYNDLRFTGYQKTLVLIGPRAELSFTTSLFFTLYIQYNTQADNININARLQWRFKPMSDVFIVYSENTTAAFLPKNRALVCKLVWWLNL
jgi:hypothetical protein